MNVATKLNRLNAPLARWLVDDADLVLWEVYCRKLPLNIGFDGAH